MSADTYISSGSITYTQVGNVVFFVAEYTMLASISNSCLLPVSSMPVPVDSLHLQFADHLNAYTYDSGVRSFGINNSGQPFLKGPHSAGTSYSCSGCYICN
jgi:hypothetical protein